MRKNAHQTQVMKRTFAKLTYLRKAGDRAASHFTHHFFQDEKTNFFHSRLKGARAKLPHLPDSRIPAKPGETRGACNPLASWRYTIFDEKTTFFSSRLKGGARESTSSAGPAKHGGTRRNTAKHGRSFGAL